MLDMVEGEGGEGGTLERRRKVEEGRRDKDGWIRKGLRSQR